MVAPAELPFAPRPYSTELLSSWLLRVAASNLVSLRELLDGFEERYGRVLANEPIDYAIPDAAVAALSQFCRVAPEKIRTLDLRRRAPQLSPALLLRYQNLSLLWFPRCSLRRVRYTFCPLCVASQRVNSCALGLERGLSDSLYSSSNAPSGRLPRMRGTGPAHFFGFRLYPNLCVPILRRRPYR
jgi:hypothetical protein